jgi:hypothetical protein
MSKKIDRKYIADHMTQIHTPDSWARAVIYHMMSEAAKKLGDGSSESVKIDAAFHVSAVETTGCIQLCYQTPIGPICVHVNI